MHCLNAMQAKSKFRAVGYTNNWLDLHWSSGGTRCLTPHGQQGSLAPSYYGTMKEGLRQWVSLRAVRTLLAFFWQVKLLHQVVSALCVIFQQREIWVWLGASGETFFSETFSAAWLYRALLLVTAEEKQVHAVSMSQTWCRWNREAGLPSGADEVSPVFTTSQETISTRKQ